MSEYAPSRGVPAGWYSDPWNPAGVRYWDGVTWAGTPSQYSAPIGDPLRAPDGTGWSTPWIWLVTLLPVVSLVISLFVPWQSTMNFDPSLSDPRASVAAMYGSFGALLSPAFWLVGIVNWGIQALCIYFAYRDHKQLMAMGVPKPFHWVWAVLGSVYPIGRSVVAVRRTGHGWPPLWATVGVLLLSVVVSVIVTVEVMSATFKMLQDLATQLPV